MAQLADAYQSTVWQGIERRGKEHGLGVVCFIGSRLESPVGSEKKANMAYELADPRAIDGLVTVSSAIATFLEARGIEQLFASRGKLPQVSVGLRVRGISSVTVDSSGSVAEIIRHMAGHHRRRRFALVGGPPGHDEAQDRVRAFRETLRDMGVSFDERLAAEGSFLRHSGAEAARALLKTGLSFDALFSVNDIMALGAIDVLREVGPMAVSSANISGRNAASARAAKKRSCGGGTQQRSGAHYMRARDEYIQTGKLGKIGLVRTFWHDGGASNKGGGHATPPEALNGKPWTKPWLPVDFARKGGTLGYSLSKAANAAWGSAPKDAPPSFGPPPKQ